MTDRRGRDQYVAPYHMVTEIVTIETPYVTGGWTLTTKQLVNLERATALQGIQDYRTNRMCRVAVPCDLQTGLMTGQGYKLQAFYEFARSGECSVEVISGYAGFSGWCVTMLFEGR